MAKLLLLCVVLGVGACTNQDTYEAIQKNQRYECQKEPNPTVREDCLKGLGTGYEEYERQRTQH